MAVRKLQLPCTQKLDQEYVDHLIGITTDGVSIWREKNGLVSRHIAKKDYHQLTITIVSMLKITIFISSISWQVSKQNVKPVSYIYSVHDISCDVNLLQ